MKVQMRLPKLTDLSPRQQEISDRITSRRGGTRGPFLVWLRSPELCEKVEALGAYCRFESSLDSRLNELSLLIAAPTGMRSTHGTRTSARPPNSACRERA
jgi:4-carboxymuconolactone decarboxylase